MSDLSKQEEYSTSLVADDLSLTHIIDNDKSLDFKKFIDDLRKNQKTLAEMKDDGFLRKNWNKFSGKNTSLIIQSLDLNNQFIRFSLYTHYHLGKNAKIIEENQAKLLEANKKIIENHDKISLTDDSLKIAIEKFNLASEQLKNMSSDFDLLNKSMKNTNSKINVINGELEKVISELNKYNSETLSHYKKISQRFMRFTISLGISFLLIFILYYYLFLK